MEANLVAVGWVSQGAEFLAIGLLNGLDFLDIFDILLSGSYATLQHCIDFLKAHYACRLFCEIE